MKFNDERVDPPVSVLDPLMSWAHEAHWSMGGLSLNRPRLQGKIEGNVQKLRKEREKSLKKKIQNATPISQSLMNVGNGGKKGGIRVDSPPPAPISKKRTRRSKLVEEEEEDDEEEIVMESRKEVKTSGGTKKRRRLVRKLGDDFELVASENQKSGRSPLKDLSNGGVSEGGVALRTRSRRSMVLMEEEEESDNGGKKSDTNKTSVQNGRAEKIKEKKIGGKGAISTNGSRSSPRLNQRLN